MINLDKVMFQRAQEQLREVRIEKGAPRGPRRTHPCRSSNCDRLVSGNSRSGLCKIHQVREYRLKAKEVRSSSGEDAGLSSRQAGFNSSTGQIKEEP